MASAPRTQTWTRGNAPGNIDWESATAQAAIPSAEKVLTGTGPAEVSFNLDGTLVAVTEKTSNTIVVFSIR